MNRLKDGGLCPTGPDKQKVALSVRECECLHWVARGKSDWEIGEILCLSESTVHWHVENLKRKLDVKTRPQAVAIAAWRRLIAP